MKGQEDSLFIWKEKAITEWINNAKSLQILTSINYRRLRKVSEEGASGQLMSTGVTSQDGQVSTGKLG